MHDINGGYNVFNDQLLLMCSKFFKKEFSIFALKAVSSEHWKKETYRKKYVKLMS